MSFSFHRLDPSKATSSRYLMKVSKLIIIHMRYVWTRDQQNFVQHQRWTKGKTFINSNKEEECCDQYWTSPGGNTTQSSSYTANSHPSWKLSKLDEPDMQDTAGEVATSSLVMYFYGPLYIAEQNQGDQLEPTYSSSVRIRGVVLMTCR